MKAEKEKKNYLGNKESLLKSCDSVKKVFVYGGMLEHDYHDTQKVWSSDCTYNSITGLRKGATLSRPSKFARDCTKAMGIM